MSNPTLASRAFKPAAPVLPFSLLREVFEATPLYIFSTAVKAVFAAKPVR
jgi:hypothetical protein